MAGEGESSSSGSSVASTVNKAFDEDGTRKLFLLCSNHMRSCTQPRIYFVMRSGPYFWCHSLSPFVYVFRVAHKDSKLASKRRRADGGVSPPQFISSADAKLLEQLISGHALIRTGYTVLPGTLTA